MYPDSVFISFSNCAFVCFPFSFFSSLAMFSFEQRWMILVVIEKDRRKKECLLQFTKCVLLRSDFMMWRPQMKLGYFVVSLFLLSNSFAESRLKRLSVCVREIIWEIIILSWEIFRFFIETTAETNFPLPEYRIKQLVNVA